MEPYKTFDLCERMKNEHGAPHPVSVRRDFAWRWGPFAGGRVWWGEEVYSVLATPWFSFWLKRGNRIPR